MQWFYRRSTKCGRGRGRRTNSARISHPPPFRRVTKNCGIFSKTKRKPEKVAKHTQAHLKDVLPCIQFDTDP